MQNLSSKIGGYFWSPTALYRFSRRLGVSALILCVLAFSAFAQTETPPAPSAPKSAAIPPVKEMKMANGLTVVTVERKNVPLVNVHLLVRRGASTEGAAKAGLADMTAALLTKGTKTRTATGIAEEIEFLGAIISTGASWNNSTVNINVTSDKLDRTMAIMADVVLNPAFKPEEIELLRTQTLDELNVNLKQPSFLGSYAAAKYTFGEHPAGGTPESLKAIARADIVNFHRNNFRPENAVLIFTGDITPAAAEALAAKHFGSWQAPAGGAGTGNGTGVAGDTGSALSTPRVVQRILVVDLPNAGQASVNYAKNLLKTGRVGSGFYPASVLNSLLGGGYSARLNQEIRIKRGLSYGAGSNFDWRFRSGNFMAATQTKNESAAEVGELIVAEIKKLTDGAIAEPELNPRKLVLTGGFSRNLETTTGLASHIAAIYTYRLPVSELNTYMNNVQAVTDKQILNFASENLTGGDLIVVGDYAKFKADLSKRFPDTLVTVIPASDLDVNRANLRKTNR